MLNSPNFMCPREPFGFGSYSATPPLYSYTHYVINQRLSGIPGHATYKKWRKQAQLTKPSEVLLLIDSRNKSNYIISGSSATGGGAGFRHGNNKQGGDVYYGDANIAYGDGHAGTESFKQVNTLTRLDEGYNTKSGAPQE